MINPILLVDDEEGIRKVLGISLADWGYRVLTAASGEEALDIVRKHRPPVVLTDVKMPGMDGIELLQRIKKEMPETEVIMVTGHGDLELAIRSIQFEAVDFITKPINDAALRIALQRARERIWMKEKLREYTQGLEQLVLEKSQRLIETERLAAIGQTVATLAHAIKNIIGGLNGGIFVVEKGMELGSQKYLTQGWAMVKGNVEKIKNLALDLLNYSKEREPEYRRINPNRVASDLHLLMQERARECGINLTVRLDERIKEISLDPDAIHCCLLNLLGNAFDACLDVENSGNPKEVVLSTALIEGGGVEYRVIDSGCGLSEEIKEKIFKAFFSTKGTRGTGLGLMIVQKIVLEHGGEVSVFSEKGKGATFAVRLPAGDIALCGKGRKENSVRCRTWRSPDATKGENNV
ncbi:MAG: response regulator [Desulfobacteraceae bacterium]|nr:response regulator [Desulfobacteraceae bacterium]